MVSNKVCLSSLFSFLLRLGEKACKFSVPFLGTSFSQKFGAEKSAKTHGNLSPDVHLSAGNLAEKFHLSVIKISGVGQVGHGI